MPPPPRICTLSLEFFLKTLTLAGLAVIAIALRVLPQDEVPFLTQNQISRAEIDDIARKAGMTNHDLERLGVAPAAPMAPQIAP